jgi:hypothetical protein
MLDFGLTIVSEFIFILGESKRVKANITGKFTSESGRTGHERNTRRHFRKDRLWFRRGLFWSNVSHAKSRSSLGRWSSGKGRSTGNKEGGGGSDLHVVDGVEFVDDVLIVEIRNYEPNETFVCSL